MVAILEDRIEAIRAACERFNVARLDVFGSVLRDDFEPGRSDIDFLVDFGSMSPRMRSPTRASVCWTPLCALFSAPRWT